MNARMQVFPAEPVSGHNVQLDQCITSPNKRQNQSKEKCRFPVCFCLDVNAVLGGFFSPADNSHHILIVYNLRSDTYSCPCFNLNIYDS